MSEKKQLISNITSLGIVQIANYVFPMISVPIVSRIIGPEHYGVINYAASFILYFTLLVNYGFDLTATRKIARHPQDRILRNKVFSEVLSAKIFLLAVSIAVFIPCLYVVKPLSKEKTVAVFTFLTVLSNVLTSNWLFQAMQNLKRIAVLNFICRLLFTVAVLAMVRVPQDYIWLPLVLSLSQILVAFLSYRWAVRIYKVSIVKVSLSRIQQILLDEKGVFFSMVVISLYTTTNTVILGLFRDSHEVGYYTSAVNLMNVIISVLSIPMAQALFPYMGKAFEENREKGLLAVKKLMPLVFYFTFFAGVVMYVLGPWIIGLFYGPDFAPSGGIFRIVVFVPMIITLSNIFGIQIMLNLNMDKPFFYITLVGAGLGILLNTLMSRYIGAKGTAWNWLIVETYITLAMLLYLRKVGIHPFDGKYFTPKNVYISVKGIFGKK